MYIVYTKMGYLEGAYGYFDTGLDGRIFLGSGVHQRHEQEREPDDENEGDQQEPPHPVLHDDGPLGPPLVWKVLQHTKHTSVRQGFLIW